jgi:hypothetical protein
MRKCSNCNFLVRIHRSGHEVKLNRATKLQTASLTCFVLRKPIKRQESYRNLNRKRHKFHVRATAELRLFNSDDFTVILEDRPIGNYNIRVPKGTKVAYIYDSHNLN